MSNLTAESDEQTKLTPIADLPRLPIRADKKVGLVSSESPNPAQPCCAMSTFSIGADSADIAAKVLERLRQVIPTGFDASQAVPVVPAVAAHS